jgi:hypothetical protein
MKNTILIVIILLSCTIFNTTYCQTKKITFFLNSADSIIVSTVYYRDKMTQLPNINKRDSIGNLQFEELADSVGKIKSRNLTNSEIKEFIKIIKKPSFNHSGPMEYDIQFDFYNQGVLMQSATISSYTKNLVIKRFGCKTVLDKEISEIDPCAFYGMVTKKQKKYIIELLIRKKLWNMGDKFFEDL